MRGYWHGEMTGTEEMIGMEKTPSWDEMSGCVGKTNYTSKSSARKDLLRIERKRKKRYGNNAVLVPYLCPFCKHYHIGHTRRKYNVKYQQIDDWHQLED